MIHWWTLKSQVDERQLQRLGEKGDGGQRMQCSDVTTSLDGGFKYFLIFIPTWERFPFWRLIFFKGVETASR